MRSPEFVARAITTPRGRRIKFALMVAGALAAASLIQNVAIAAQDPQWVLERAVMVMRHGVRPPTRSATELAPLADSPWPDDATWGVAPGELTSHGGEAIRIVGAGINELYSREGLLPRSGDLGQMVVIWADGGDQRTRASAIAFAEGMGGQLVSRVGWKDSGSRDELFEGPAPGKCPLDAQAIDSALHTDTVDSVESMAALHRLQQIVAPEACKGGAGTCLNGTTRLVASPSGVKLQGPLATGATLAEDLLLEYEDGLPADQVGWGRASREDLNVVMVAHRRSAQLTRQWKPMAERRASVLSRFVLAALQGDPAKGASMTSQPPIPEPARLIVLVGHDTNLSNLAGVFDVDWTLPGQADPTAPGTAIAFERWRNSADGATELRMRIFYQSMDQVRTLAREPINALALHSGLCASSGNCPLDALAVKVQDSLARACP